METKWYHGVKWMLVKRQTEGHAGDTVVISEESGHGYIARLWNGRTNRDQYAELLVAAPETATERDSYRDELLKLASELGEGDDPFAAWESLASLLSVQKQLVEALEELRWVGNDLRERKAARAKADAAILAAKASS